MGENVGVGMAFQPKIARDRNAAENERPPDYDAVHIPAQAGSDLHQDAGRAASSSARNNRARSISEGLVILILRSLPWTTLTSTSSSRSTRLDSSVPVKESDRAAANARFSKSKRKT